MPSKKKSRSAECEALAPAIGEALREIGPAKTRDRLLYAELAAGVSAVSVYCRTQAPREYRFFQGSEELHRALIDCWRTCRDAGDRWRAMTFRLRGEHFTMEFVYPDHFDEEMLPNLRRKSVVAEALPGMKVVYPKMTLDDL
jgi:hypothetical protein